MKITRSQKFESKAVNPTCAARLLVDEEAASSPEASEGCDRGGRGGTLA